MTAGGDGGDGGDGGREAGSSLIGQSWDGEDGKPDPRWFQGRPSNSEYDALSTGSGQLGASDRRLPRPDAGRFLQRGRVDARSYSRWRRSLPSQRRRSARGSSPRRWAI